MITLTSAYRKIFLPVVAVAICLFFFSVAASAHMLVTSKNPGTGIAPGTPPPYSLVMFSTSVKNNQVITTWTVSGEEQLKDFVLEGSTDGKTFRTIRLVTARNAGTYTLVNRRRANLCDYYRLKMIDIDGGFSYSPVVTANTEDEADTKENLYQINVEAGWVSQVGTVTITDAKGFVLITRKFEKLSNTEMINISQLAPGSYIVKLIVNENVIEKKLEIPKK
ncbi:MAG: T9SS type A sorting domain-containing protein [Chitinophagaceae bacterium]